MAMCPDGGLLLLGSSVHRKRGYMFRKWRELYGNDESESICWFAPSAVMNPKLPVHVVDRALAEDVHKARAEYLNIWREDLAEFLPIDVVQACTDWDVYERAPKPDTRYVAYVDAASGTGKDSYALAIAHVEPDQTVVIDAVRERKPRFVPAQIIAEYSELLATYHVTEVHDDNYAAGFHSSEWSNHPTPFRPSKDSTSDNYLGALPVMLARRAHLLGPAIVRLSSKRMGISVGAQPSMAGIARARVMSALNGTDVAPWARPSPPKNPCRGGAGLGPPAKQLAPRARLPGSCFRYASGSCPPAAPFCQHIDEALLFPANGAESAHAA